MCRDTALILCAMFGCSAKPAAQAGGYAPSPVKTQIARMVPTPVTSQYLASIEITRIRRHQSAGGGLDPEDQRAVRENRFAQASRYCKLIQPYSKACEQSSGSRARPSKPCLPMPKRNITAPRILFKSGIISKQDFDTYKATYDNALAQLHALDAQVNQQQAQLHYYSVTAPTDGIIGDIPVHVGDRVSNYTLLTTVDRARQSGSLYLCAHRTRRKICTLDEGVDLLDEAGQVIAHSSIFFVSPSNRHGTQTLLAKALIANPGE